MTLTIKISVAVLVSMYCLICTDAVKDAVSEAVMRCLTTVIPSLYGMMIMSGILIKSGIFDKTPRSLLWFGRKAFGMTGSIFPIFIFSMFAGYPVGAKMLCTELDEGRISRREAELFSGICFGAGPAFIFGCISSQLYSSPVPGRIILISSVCANVILAFILSFPIKKIKSTNPALKTRPVLSSDMITKITLNSGRSMADICIMITAFSVLNAFLHETGILRLISNFGITDGIADAVFDVTAVNGIPAGNYTVLPLLSALCSFGGICVIMQIAALTSGKISIRPIIIMRIAAGILSGIICHIIMPFFIEGETVSTADIKIQVHSAPSPVPSVLLIIMTVILFYRSSSSVLTYKQEY